MMCDHDEAVNYLKLRPASNRLLLNIAYKIPNQPHRGVAALNVQNILASVCSLFWGENDNFNYSFCHNLADSLWVVSLPREMSLKQYHCQTKELLEQFLIFKNKLWGVV